ncbi:MAG TPA: peptidylprolyl isomerase [Ignavibacteriaceae bacterium]|jgi:RNA recognition motif-containing protein|nr:peptidylprolyl isomerase [Ignavibacteriaceae bacterium]
MILNFITINLKKLIKIQIKLFLLILTAMIITGCGKESPKKEFIARVNDSYFTRADLSAVTDSGYGRNLYKNEIVRNWIDKELLYQEAKNTGVLKGKEFQRVENESRRQLAVTFLVNKLFEEEQVAIEPSELKDYFEKNKENFKLFHDAFQVNLVQFDDEDKAILFRDEAFEKGWDKAEESFKNDSNIVYKENANLVYDYEIQPADLVRLIRELLPGEISIVINDGMGNYFVVQLLQKYNRGSIPPYEVIDELVHDRYVALKREQFIKKYVRDLYSKNDIEVK